MALFQSTVVQKYVKAQNQKELQEKWEAFQAHFHNPSIQENIRNAKEEQYQEGFLRDLFVKILGYTLNPDTNFNLTTELKNVKDSKKADGGILVKDKVVGVIELKGTNTTDLSKVETQAFGYKNNQTNCRYVITSNFEKLRFYIDNAIEHQSFNLFELTQEQFNLLYLCLAYQNISKDTPKKIKTESLSQEDAVTKQLYKDYSLFKRELFNNLTQLNPDVDALLLFKKSQKLLDRFLFLFFAEDRHLLPPNSVRLILKQWKQLQELDAYTPLYKRFKKYFGYLNTGHKGKQYDVYPYNGGLFKPDEVLDQVKIDDDLLYAHTLKLSEYDFDSEVDVNILGHIFENSLNEIEEIQTQLEENPDQAEVKISKRKKYGVFYTPKYITKYIVENTVGKLCEEQKETLSLVEDDYQLNRKKKTKEKLLQKLKDYRDWLLQLTIVDPACGSGAFLNEALNFLIAEHQYVDELETKLMGGGFVFPNVENSILENNLFGVDINNESVEIAKLSLWLRTAQPNRKLNDLSGNIKCGNSLIDDPEVAGDKAFSWENEFPQVFQEKDKHAYHITTALHDSRTSKRMLDYKVREKRKGGTNPFPNYEKLTAEEEVLIAEEVLGIVKEDKLKILAFNVCADHIHILLVCEEEDVPKIMQKIKAKTARTVNIHKGITIPSTKEPAPLPSQKEQPAPLPQRGKKQNSLWTQKYGCKPITDETQLHNTINYIQHNRYKHNLPESQTLNKLIDNLCCTLEEAFTPEYKGGFDVVIGNPPYVRVQNLDYSVIDWFKNNMSSAFKRIDISILFIEKSLGLINEDGLISFITSNQFFKAEYGRKIRELIIGKLRINLDFSKVSVFEGLSTYVSILNFGKTYSQKFYYKEIENTDDIANNIIWDTFQFSDYNSDSWEFSSDKPLKDKIYKGSNLLEDIVDFTYGIITGNDKSFILDSEEVKDYLIEDEIIFPFVKPENYKRYCLNNIDKYIIYPYDSENNILSESEFKKTYSNAYLFLLKNKEILENRKDSRTTLKEKGIEWYSIMRRVPPEDIKKEKLIFFDVGNHPNFFYDDQSLSFGGGTSHSVYLKREGNIMFILGVLNSKLMSWIIRDICPIKMGDARKYGLSYMKRLPIKLGFQNFENLINVLVEKIISQKKKLNISKNKFQRNLQRQFPEELEKLPKKLQDWYALSFADFIKELKKKKIKLSLSQEAEWEDYFLAEQAKATNLKNQIDQTDKEIDQMVYELYGLTDEEIKIVEKS